MSSTPSPDELVDRFEPRHLRDAPVPEKTEDLKAEVEKAVDPPPPDPEKPDLNDPKLKEEYAFTMDFTDARGGRHVGDFVNKILSIRERQMAGVMRARLNGALPPESLDPMTDELNLMVSHMAFSLVKRPVWANELRDLNDPAILQELYKEVLSHEATFLGWGRAEGTGEG